LYLLGIIKPMDTDNKTTDVNNITGGEKDTLHNAGVDLSSSDVKEEEFVDIDKVGSVNDPELKDIGLEFSTKDNKEDLSMLKEQMDKKGLVERQKATSASVFKDEQPNRQEKEEIKISQKIVEESTFEPKINTEPKKTETDISDLEKEFNQTVGKSSASLSKNESLNEKVSSLQSMLSKIQEKLGLKKKEVKEELSNLKKVKEDIAKDIENIKDLEDSKDKIESQLGKVEAIKSDIENIEKEVEEELKS
jgi:chromosome segregation ATPase